MHSRMLSSWNACVFHQAQNVENSQNNMNVNEGDRHAECHEILTSLQSPTQHLQQNGKGRAPGSPGILHINVDEHQKQRTCNDVANGNEQNSRYRVVTAEVNECTVDQCIYNQNETVCV